MSPIAVAASDSAAVTTVNARMEAGSVLSW
jgi:hypothetical protein